MKNRSMLRGMLLPLAAAIFAMFFARHVRAQVGEYGQQARGRYLVDAGDCAACHTAEGGAMLAGGRPIKTPFGTIYSPNITPDPETGIGGWTDDQFYRAMHEGIAEDGSHLYPAFPYPWFTKTTRQDITDIRAYLRTIPPVRYRRPNNTLGWPMSDRLMMAGWNALFFKAGPYQPDPNKSAQWNRGAYLVQGLAHCGGCHTPTNAFGASDHDKALHGGELNNWYAPNLAGDKRDGLGSWRAAEIVQFLKTGQIDRTVAYGPMAEVVQKSTSRLTDDDLTAIATYLKSLPATGNADETPDRPAKGVAEAGAAIYSDSCSACHRQGGEGIAGLFPALKGNAIVQSAKPTTLLRLILDGGQAASTSAAPTAQGMPAFDWKLTDQQIAAVASYVRAAWGNAASPVSTATVRDLRNAVRNVTNAKG